MTTPVTNPDFFDAKTHTRQSTPIQQPPPSGVLLNDTGTNLTAVITVPPPHADFFSLLPSGDFIYKSETGFTGDDGFKYKAWDGSDYGAEVVVTIHVLSASAWSNKYPGADASLLSVTTI